MFTTLISVDQLKALQASGAPLMIFDCSFDLKNTAAGEEQYRKAHIPGAVYSNVDTSPHSDDPATIRRTLATQVTQGVRWEESIRRMLADGFDTFYEIGPGRVLTGLLKRIDRKTPCTSAPAR